MGRASTVHATGTGPPCIKPGIQAELGSHHITGIILPRLPSFSHRRSPLALARPRRQQPVRNTLPAGAPPSRKPPAAPSALPSARSLLLAERRASCPRPRASPRALLAPSGAPWAPCSLGPRPPARTSRPNHGIADAPSTSSGDASTSRPGASTREAAARKRREYGRILLLDHCTLPSLYT
ncbi:hypothetical protein DFH07DRAFT_968151 [Mycena maculata]|uniref:Uncharacterized protein n=1 Tax=Mycena maculata TaxID=230809 RepID=A0AAD7I1N1_9AGAR|nr:hypothetical protein DFH07DRAFT_968151 [Mycena maculata]